MSRRFEPYAGTATTAQMITEHQSRAIAVLHDQLGRTCPDLWHLTFEQAGDLIVTLRAELGTP